MTFEYENAVKELQAKDEIRDLVLVIVKLSGNRDIDLLVTLYTPDASFGSMGTGEDALKAMAEATMEQLEFAVILVANHRITFLSKCEAKGELWARCYAQNKKRRLLRTNNQIHRSIRAIPIPESGNSKLEIQTPSPSPLVWTKVKSLLDASSSRLAQKQYRPRKGALV